MQLKESTLMEWVITGLTAASFILVMKLIFLGPLKVPGLSNAVAAI